MRYPQVYLSIGIAAFSAIPCALALAQVFTSGNRALTVMGYDAPVRAIDRSNSSTPDGIPFVNTDYAADPVRKVAEVKAFERVLTTKTNTSAAPAA